MSDAMALAPLERSIIELKDIGDEAARLRTALLDGLDPSRTSFVGEDFARSGDRTVLVPLLQQKNLQLKPPFVLELGNMPFAQQEQIMAHLLRGLPNLLGAALDARGNGQSLAETMQDQFGAETVEAVMLSENWYRIHTAPFKAALEDGTLDGLPKDEDILNDLRAFELINGVPRIPATRTWSARASLMRNSM